MFNKTSSVQVIQMLSVLFLKAHFWMIISIKPIMLVQEPSFTLCDIIVGYEAKPSLH